jgi:hypothetical protein
MTVKFRGIVFCNLWNLMTWYTKTNSGALFRKRTIPSERRSLFGEVSANFKNTVSRLLVESPLSIYFMKIMLQPSVTICTVEQMSLCSDVIIVTYSFFDRQRSNPIRVTLSCDEMWTSGLTEAASGVSWSLFLATDPEVPGSIPGATRFFEK